MTAQLVHVDPLFPPLWERVAHYLDMALEEGGGKRDWGLDDIFCSAIRNDIDTWVLCDADGIFGACATTLNVYPRRRALDVLLLGTEPHREADWLICLEQLSSIARTAGATMITGTGRPGWARKLGCKERRTFEYEVAP